TAPHRIGVGGTRGEVAPINKHPLVILVVRVSLIRVRCVDAHVVPHGEAPYHVWAVGRANEYLHEKVITNRRVANERSRRGVNGGGRARPGFNCYAMARLRGPQRRSERLLEKGEEVRHPVATATVADVDVFVREPPVGVVVVVQGEAD